MSIQKVNVEQKLAQIKAMGGDKNIVDTVQEQFQLSVFYNEVNLNPQKYSYEDRKMVDKCMSETKTLTVIKLLEKMGITLNECNIAQKELLRKLETLIEKPQTIEQSENIDKIIKLLIAINDNLEQMSK